MSIISVIVVDRTEGDYAVCECGGRMFNLPLELFGEAPRDGASFELTLTSVCDGERRLGITAKFEALKNKSKKGDRDK